MKNILYFINRASRAVCGRLCNRRSHQSDALIISRNIGQCAARIGFDWPEVDGAINKVEEEIAELREVIAAGELNRHRHRLSDELGDILFSIVNVARKLDIDPRDALLQTCDKFNMRFQYVESSLAKQGKVLEDATLDEMEVLWQKAKTNISNLER